MKNTACSFFHVIPKSLLSQEVFSPKQVRHFLPFSSHLAYNTEKLIALSALWIAEKVDHFYCNDLEIRGQLKIERCLAKLEVSLCMKFQVDSLKIFRVIIRQPPVSFPDCDYFEIQNGCPNWWWSNPTEIGDIVDDNR